MIGKLAVVAVANSATAAGLAVIYAAFTLSFDSIKDVGVAAHIRPEAAWRLPVAVDGAMIVATVAALVAQRAGRSPLWPYVVVGVGAGISIACNMVHALPREGGRALTLDPVAAALVSAIPAVMLAVTVHLAAVMAAQLVAVQQPATPVAAATTQPATTVGGPVADTATRAAADTATGPVGGESVTAAVSAASVADGGLVADVEPSVAVPVAGRVGGVAARHGGAVAVPMTVLAVPDRHPVAGRGGPAADPPPDLSVDPVVVAWLAAPEDQRCTVKELAAQLSVSQRTAERRIEKARTAARERPVNGSAAAKALTASGGHGA